MTIQQKPVLRCAIHSRKSSEEGLEQSIDAQREACEVFVVSHQEASSDDLIRFTVETRAQTLRQRNASRRQSRVFKARDSHANIEGRCTSS